MAEETIFSKIINKEIPADLLYQDDLVTAFRDINPRAPSHILIIPNKLIPTTNDVEVEDKENIRLSERRDGSYTRFDIGNAEGFLSCK